MNFLEFAVFIPDLSEIVALKYRKRVNNVEIKFTLRIKPRGDKKPFRKLIDYN